MNEKIKKLIDLQEIDKESDQYRLLLDRLPEDLERFKLESEGMKRDYDSEKKKLTDALLKKKDKEVELASCEEKMRKGEMELNTIKSNDTYKLKMKEIDQFKDSISKVEDDILVLMDEIDHITSGIKKMELDHKNRDAQLLKERGEKESQITKIQSLHEGVLKKRDEFSSLIENELLSSYETIRKKRKGAVLASIIGESCGGCHTILTPNTINEVKKAKDLVLCDTCSMILYIEEIPSAAYRSLR